MKSCVIHDLPEWQVTSYGNGLAYCLLNKPAALDILFQGDDAQEFSLQLEDLTEGTPSLDYDDALRVIWSDYAESCARPTVGALVHASRFLD